MSLEEIPAVLGPAFQAGDAAAEEKPREGENVERIARRVHAIAHDGDGRLATLRSGVGEVGRRGAA